MKKLKIALALIALFIAGCGTMQCQNEYECAVSRCESAMYSMPTRSGTFGESVSRASLCKSDPNAHLKIQNTQQRTTYYTCQNGFPGTGTINCTGY